MLAVRFRKYIRFSKEQRLLYGEKLVDLAHISLGGLVFTQLVSAENASLLLFIFGLLFAAITYTMSYIITRPQI